MVRSCDWVTISAGVLAAIVGLTGLLGWHLGDAFLIQIHPLFTPLAYPVAVGLALSGSGLAAVACRWRQAGQAAGLLVLALSVLFFLQCFHIAPALQWPAHPSLALLDSPGAMQRVGLNTATCFLLQGLALLLMSWKYYFQQHPLQVGLFGATLAALSSVAFFGYVAGFTTLHSQDLLSRVAIQEILGHSLSAVGILALVWRATREGSANLLRWLPLFVGACFLTATLILWQALTAQERGRLERLIQAEAANVQREIQELPQNQFAPLARAAHDRALRNPGEQRTTELAAQYIRSQPGCLAIAQVTQDSRLQWIQALQDPARIERMISGSEGQHRAELENLWAQRQLTVWRAPGGWLGRRLLLVYAPILRGQNTEGGYLAVFSCHELLDAVLHANVAPHYAITVFDGDEPIYLRYPAERDHEMTWGRESLVNFQNLSWRVRVWPTAEVLAGERFSLAKVALIVGFLMTLLLALAVHLAQMARRRAREMETQMHERRQAEEALRQSEAKYRALIENLENSVVLKDRQHRYVAVNKHFCQTLGRLESDIIGKTDFELYPRLLAERYHSDEELVLSEGRRLELELQTPAGEKMRTVRLIRTPVKDSQGQVTGTLGIFWDVTDQRNLEAQLRQAQKMEAVGQLAGGIAHDFNNLLTVILGNVSLLASQLPAHDPSRDSIAAAEQAAQRAANLTKQLLGFSRHAFVRSEPTDVKGIMDEVTTLLSRTIDPRISIEVQCAADVWRVHSDPSQMSQILMNLCLNARDAMPEGGRLRLEAHNVTLTPDDVRWQLDGRPGEFVRLRVSDTGHGMTPEIRARIFEPFFTTKEPGRGTGLGLAMVFGIVRRHQGWINCDSEVGRGTRFDLYLPRFREDAACAEAMSAPAPPTQGTETILIAEDEPLIRRLTATVLASLGYQVFAAEDGQEAVEIFQREHGQIDLVLLDLTMPRLSGRDAFRRLRELDPHVRVLFTSGYSEEHVTDAEQEYVLGFISKPYRPEELAKTVRRILDHHRRREKTQAALAGS